MSRAVSTARGYKDALQILQARRRPARPTTSASPALKHVVVASDVKGTPSLHGMEEWLKILGHTDDDMRSLNVVHVAGTKGKGSTCAFIETMLRAHGQRTGAPLKTGLYTSPHLITPVERIRLNRTPISKESFTTNFFEVFDGLQKHAEPSGFTSRPRYLQLWALTAFHTFIKEKVEVAVIETHHGGEYDATNFIKDPAVTVVTTLGMDHVQQLGPGLADIAWHKAGIFKHGAAAVSAPQATEAAQVLEQRATEKSVELEFADAGDKLKRFDLPAEVLRTNCSVAITASNAWLRKIGGQDSHLSDTDIEAGVKDFSWPGRFERVSSRHIEWFLDSAHNEMSVDKAAQWFHESLLSLDRKLFNTVLLFSHMSRSRDWEPLLRQLLQVLKTSDTRLDGAVFTTYRHSESSDDEADAQPVAQQAALLQQFSDVLSEYFPQAVVRLNLAVDDAVTSAQELVEASGNANVFVTGSQKVVGGVLKCIRPEP